MNTYTHLIHFVYTVCHHVDAGICRIMHSRYHIREVSYSAAVLYTEGSSKVGSVVFKQ